ncbi:neck protein [Vibrio phage 489E54-1]|nr:neck protein [Vibrio phage 489E54-1]
MARQLITMSDGGFDAWIDEIDTAADMMPQIMLTSLEARQEVIESAIRTEWMALGGTGGGFVASSIGQSAKYSKENPLDVVGTVGVYDMDSVRAAFGKTEKDLNAAQIAYWTEFGTSRLKMGGRKQKGVEYSDEMLITVHPKPFISRAVYNSYGEAEKAFRNMFNQEYERLVK